MRIRARRLSNGSLFKLIFVGVSISLFPFFILCGIASIFGANTVRLNDSPVTGPVGLMAALIMYPIFALGFSCLAWLIGAFGLWIGNLGQARSKDVLSRTQPDPRPLDEAAW